MTAIALLTALDNVLAPAGFIPGRLNASPEKRRMLREIRTLTNESDVNKGPHRECRRNGKS